MKEVACSELLFGRHRAADQHTLELLKEVRFGKEGGRCAFTDFAVEVMDRDKSETLETNAGLTAFSLFTRNCGVGAVDRLDVGAAEKTPVSLTAVENQESVDIFVIEHRLERLQFKR